MVRSVGVVLWCGIRDWLPSWIVARDRAGWAHVEELLFFSLSGVVRCT